MTILLWLCSSLCFELIIAKLHLPVDVVDCTLIGWNVFGVRCLKESCYNKGRSILGQKCWHLKCGDICLGAWPIYKLGICITWVSFFIFIFIFTMARVGNLKLIEQARVLLIGCLSNEIGPAIQRSSASGESQEDRSTVRLPLMRCSGGGGMPVGYFASWTDVFVVSDGNNSHSPGSDEVNSIGRATTEPSWNVAKWWNVQLFSTTLYPCLYIFCTFFLLWHLCDDVFCLQFIAVIIFTLLCVCVRARACLCCFFTKIRLC